MARKNIDTLWDRKNRNNINENFKELYNKSNEADNLAKDTERRVWKNERDIKELYEGTGQALDAAKQAREQARNAENKANEAESQANYAKNQGDYAKSIADNIAVSSNNLHNVDDGKTYNWGLRHENGHLIFMYEEAK